MHPDHIHAPNVVISLISMHNTFRAILAMTTFLVTGALSSCNHTDELEPESPAPQIVFLFSPGGLGDMSYNDRILEGVQRFKMENGDIDIYIYSPESLQEAEKIFADWLERPQSSIPVLFVLGSSDYEPMAELYLAEHDLTPNKSILLFESRKQYKDENIHTFQISMFGASYLAGVCARKCSEMTPLVLLANNTDSPINIAKDGFIAGYGSDCDVEYLADDWTGYVSASLAYRKMSDWAVDYDFIFPVASQVRAYYDAHWNDADHEHIVQPGMVYISHPTENGTIYSKSELQELYATCKELGLPLFMDGARMGYGLMSEKSDMTLADIAANTDVFYIGGTKVGALFGEAVVITKSALKKDFRYCMKQSGAMLAKGRLLGIQFDTLFTDDLYFKIAAHADKLAMKLKNAFLEKGYKMYFDSYTNQQYPILSKKDREKLAQKYQFSFWEQIDEDYAAVRFCTSWATSEEAIDELIQDI